MIPIEKNIIVTDVDGKQIGTTYPKRARGLLKNGRAEYVSDREIRLKSTRAPAVDINTEDAKMSKVINFNTRDFTFEDTCKSNVGFRGFVSTALGNEEIWEIGDWGWNWTQICTELTGLDKNTDYIFRFAMTLGHNDDNREESLVHIFRSYPDVPVESSDSQVVNVANEGLPESAGDGIEKTSRPARDDLENARKQAWDERYTYCIRQSRFKPVISKRDTDEDTMLRVFELPFNTGNSQNWKIVIVSNHAIARFFRAKDAQAYSELEDLSYDQWREQRTAKLNAEQEKKRLAQIEAGQRIAMAAANPEFKASNLGSVQGLNAPNFGSLQGFNAPNFASSPDVTAAIENAVEDAVEDAISNAMSEISDNLQERIEESINDSISEFFNEGIESFMSSHQFTLKDGTIVSDAPRTKVLSPDRKKLLTCYGGLTVEDTSKWDGKLAKGWGLRVQTRISCWEILYIYDTEKEATDALVRVKDGIERGDELVDLSTD